MDKTILESLVYTNLWLIKLDLKNLTLKKQSTLLIKKLELTQDML